MREAPVVTFVRKLLDRFAVEVAARLAEPLAQHLVPIVTASVERHLAPDTLRPSGVTVTDETPSTERSAGARLARDVR